MASSYHLFQELQLETLHDSAFRIIYSEIYYKSTFIEIASHPMIYCLWSICYYFSYKSFWKTQSKATHQFQALVHCLAGPTWKEQNNLQKLKKKLLNLGTNPIKFDFTGIYCCPPLVGQNFVQIDNCARQFLPFFWLLEFI